MEKTSACKPKLLVVIVDRGRGRLALDVCEQEGMAFSILCLGRGTARSELLDYLGLGETEKDVVIGTVAAGSMPRLLERLGIELHMSAPGNGMAFTVPVSSVGGPRTLEFLCGKQQREERK